MTRWQRLLTNLLYWMCRIFGYLPNWFLYYVVAEVIYFIIYHVAHYRVKVTRENLENSFPEKDVKELRSIERKYYRHLAEVFVDTIDLTGISRRQLDKRMVVVDEEEHREKTKDIDWIAALGHYGSWEYFSAYAEDGEKREALGVYRPLHSVVFDQFYLRMRHRLSVVPVTMNLTIRHIINDRRAGRLMSIGLIGDQSPPPFKIDHCIKFLNQPTAFYHGMENIATRFGMKVYFVWIKKTSRAHYEYSFEEIYDGKEQLPEFEITRRYASRLEKMIQERPELWMWSHRRWKHKPGPELMEKYLQENK